MRRRDNTHVLDHSPAQGLTDTHTVGNLTCAQEDVFIILFSFCHVTDDTHMFVYELWYDTETNVATYFAHLRSASHTHPFAKKKKERKKQM